MGRVESILEVLDKMFPNAYCELNHTNAFELVIAVLLSAQTTDKSVNKVTSSLFEKYQTPEDFVAVDISQLEEDLRRIGLFRNKAKNIKALSQMIITDYNGVVPSSQVELEKLPGVGRKTANVVLSVWFQVPRIAVDTHVERIAKRLKLAYENDSVRTVEDKLMRKIPKDKWSKTHHQLIFFGRYHCMARNPNCSTCELKDLCKYKQK